MPQLLQAGDHVQHYAIKWGNAELNQPFQLTAANSGKLSMSMFVELDPNIFGVMVPKVGVQIT